MGSVHKIGNEFYIEFFARGLKYQQKAGPDRVAAEKLLADIEAKIAKGELNTIVRDADVDIFLKDFLGFAEREYPEATFKRFTRAMQHFSGFLGKRSERPEKLSQITPVVLEEYRLLLTKAVRNKKPLNPQIINLTLALLREFFEHGRRLGYLNDNPMLHIRLVPSARTKKSIPDEETVRRSLQELGQDERDAAQFLLWTGCRAGELEKLQWRNIDWVNNSIEFPGRRFPMDFQLKDFFMRLKKNAGSGQAVFKKAPGRTAQGEYRNIFACRYLQKNPSLFSLARLLGVKDIARVVKYADFLTDQSNSIYTSPFSV